MIQRRTSPPTDSPGTLPLLGRDPRRSQRVLGLVLWLLFLAILIGIGR